MTEIKKGEYVRTIKGIIFKADQNFYLHNDIPLKFATFSDRVISHNVEILEIIKPGDYINGSKLISIDYAEDEFGNCDKLHFYYHFEDDEKDVNEYYEKLIIKSIATKEQFEGIEYRLED